MTVAISHSPEVQAFFAKAAGVGNDQGNPRLKQIVLRILQDSAKLIEDLAISDDEFWTAVDYLNRLGSRNEAGLLMAGLGLEHFLDLLSDARDSQAGHTGGTPRTIEGPLYVAGAPLCEGEARLDDGCDPGQPMLLEGQVLDLAGQPLAGAIVDVWHANTQGLYSYFDSDQSAYNLRRRIVTNAQGRYRAHSIVPSGYGCPADGPTQACLDQLGRHGQRPAHIHFFISAPGYRHLTTQINLAGDAYLWDDFAHATRDGLVGEVERLEGGVARVVFDFCLQPAAHADDEQRSQRPRALQTA
ncbi:catechol 1,2-dioxygenase [Pseudomonas putida]|uniref:catechol 1,2-dioxygenase n=1 Tax=Pseudomonas putida TaxID=303 RepID=UPI00235B899A|nr:catechol 1,2-dioxygenase [Pseudomonas putida]GLO46056.1 catechol 1,2-dioxygenase [Pseudomonas putida]HDS0981457.1 catechol 1,2-dioxygenase [Pseudomonas putida]